MARDKTARSRIRQHLASHGPVQDPSGHATGVLQEAIAYLGSPVAFIQLVAAMDRDGEIIRDIRGKRTYRIELTEQAATLVSATAPTSGLGVAGAAIDYDQLARAVLRQLVATVANGASEASSTTGAASSPAAADDYAARLRAARQEIDSLLAAAEREAGAVETSSTS